MKKLFFILTMGSVIVLSSCIKQIDKTFQGTTVVEIDQAPLNSNAVNVTYPILTRIPPEGRPLSTSVDSTLRRFSGTIRLRVNLVGPQSETDQTVGYTVFAAPSSVTTVAFPATITGQTPTRTSATLNVVNAVAGTHYTALSGKVTIPAKSSFGYITIQVLNTNTAATEARFIGIELNNTGSLPPSENYKRIGLVIDQR